MGFSDCEKCRECCYFEEDERYFAPLFTGTERDAIDLKASFKPFKNSDNVFQVELEESGERYVCPFLNEETHLCRIYKKRPFDCSIWPFLFMKDRDGETVLACFERDMCPDFDKMSDDKFSKLCDAKISWIKQGNILNFLKEHKELVWDYEEDTIIIKKIK
jgi:Fe-S-cluster containining protein